MTTGRSPEPPTRIPPAIHMVFTRLKEVVIEIHFRWLTYRELFTVSEARVDLLNECAGPFFVIIHELLLAEVQLDVCKLIERARSGKHENLSLEQLQERLTVNGDSSLAQQCSQFLAQIQMHAAHFRDRRNKKLAHIDLTTALGAALTPLAGGTRKAIEDTLRAVRTYMNAIENHYDGAETGYEHSLIHEGATALVARLQDSRRYHEHIRTGRLPVDDWRHGCRADIEAPILPSANPLTPPP